MEDINSIVFFIICYGIFSFIGTIFNIVRIAFTMEYEITNENPFMRY